MEKGSLPGSPSLRGAPVPLPAIQPLEPGGALLSTHRPECAGLRVAGPSALLPPAMPPPGVEALLAACEGGADPLAAVLDLFLGTLSAGFVVCADLPAGEGRLAVGRHAPGRSIARPERLLAGGLPERILRERRPVIDLDRASRGAWLFGWPLPSRGAPRAAVFAGARRPLRPEILPGLPAAAEGLLPWIALAREMSLLLRENLAMKERLDAAEPACAVHPVLAGGPLPGPDPAEGTSQDVGQDEFPGVIAFSPPMREVLRTVAIIAPSDAAVLIEGESGTGKELIARAIHDRSARAGGPFVSESCAACPEGLQESEFFGVERGAFTGAHRTKAGLFERAQGGTLLLDEIGEMDLKLQRKLLRALQERKVRRVGGGESIPVDFRLISATNRVLSEEARTGRFRPDLLYRLEVVTLRLPPLRDRPEDIPHLIRHFLALHAKAAGRPPPRVEEPALRLLVAYHWPGNVRELQNEMWRAVALRFKAITPACLSAKIAGAGRRSPGLQGQVLPGGRSFDEVERDFLGGLIREALRKTRGNKIRAAALLGIPKTNLYRRIRRYAIGEA